MTEKDIKEIILSILTEMGILVTDCEDDLDLTELIVNSIDFIAFFIELEDALEIDLPAQLLHLDNIKSINSFAKKIKQYKIEQQLNERYDWWNVCWHIISHIG